MASIGSLSSSKPSSERDERRLILITESVGVRCFKIVRMWEDLEHLLVPGGILLACKDYEDKSVSLKAVLTVHEIASRRQMQAWHRYARLKRWRY